MKPKVLKNEEEYASALARVEKLMDAEPGSPDEEDLELWSLLVEEYERRLYAIDLPDPIEAIRFRMDQLGLQQKDLTKYIPAKSKVSEVLSGKRPLSLSMIRALHKNLGIPAEVLVREAPGRYGRTAAERARKTRKQAAARKGRSKAGSVPAKKTEKGG